MQNRTDLALELKEEKNIGSAQSGIIVKTRIDTTNHIKETKIIIKNKKGEDSLGKPKGTYITIEAKDLSTNDGSFHKEMSEAMLNKKKKILIAGLGNAGVTADSLGPKVVNNLYITRHLQKEGIGNYQFELSAIAPGVMAQTGIETSEILESLADRIKPDVVIVIDALAARSYSRLNKTIQISDTGIAPGSGVGNHRNEITQHTIGVPVLAIGVPTVISVPAIIHDVFGEKSLENVSENIDEEFISMHVTPKNIDESMKRISYTISEGIIYCIIKI